MQADAAHLPFRDGSFDAVSRQPQPRAHGFARARTSELGRVVRRGASLYVAVADASTFSDKLYRWIYHGGGHINPFRSSAELNRRITQSTGLQPVAVSVYTHRLSICTILTSIPGRRAGSGFSEWKRAFIAIFSYR